MPRYHFDTADGTRVRDAVGTVLPDLNRARVEAVKFAGMVLAHEPHHVLDGNDFRVEVSDDQRTLLFVVVTSAVDAAAARVER